MLPVYGRALLGALPVRRQRSSHVPSRELTSRQVLDPRVVAEFASVVGSPVGNVVPPAYLHILGFPLSMRLMTDPGFPLPVLGMVHVRNSFTQLRPVLVGEEVVVSVKVAAPRQHKRGTEIDLRVRGTVDGQRVFVESATYLAKGAVLPGAAPARADVRTEFEAPVPTAVWRLPASVGRKYAAVSGDYNPIHLNTLAAKAFGFPRTIAHGMYSAARAFASVGTRLTAFEWTVDFVKPLVLPATVGFRVVGGDADGRREFAVWDPKSGKPHVLSLIDPLDDDPLDFDF